MDRLGYARVKAMHYSAFVESQHPRDESGQFTSTIEFEPHPSAKLSPRKFVTVQADAAKLDSEWAKMKGHYLPKDGKGESEIEGRRAGFEEFLKSGKKIQQPHVVLNAQGQLAFNDGRHRTRVLMNRGLKTIPLTVPKGDADKIRELVGVE